MSLKAKLEAIIYAAEEPVTLDQMLAVLGSEIEQELGSAAPPTGASELTELVQAAAEAQLAEDDSAAAGRKHNGEAALAQADGDASSEAQPEPGAKPKQRSRTPDPKTAQRAYLRKLIEELEEEYSGSERGMEIREVAGGWRMATKPEHHDVVRGFAKSLKPPVRLSLQALETLAVIAYKQPVTAPEISEIRGVDCSGVLATLIDRKLITTAGRKQVIGRPILYKTAKEFLLRFGLRDLNELPSMEEFEKMTAGMQSGLFEQQQAEAWQEGEQPREAGVGPGGQSAAAEEAPQDADGAARPGNEAAATTNPGPGGEPQDEE